MFITEKQFQKFLTLFSSDRAETIEQKKFRDRIREVKKGGAQECEKVLTEIVRQYDSIVKDRLTNKSWPTAYEMEKLTTTINHAAICLNDDEFCGMISSYDLLREVCKTLYNWKALVRFQRLRGLCYKSDTCHPLYHQEGSSTYRGHNVTHKIGPVPKAKFILTARLGMDEHGKIMWVKFTTD